MKYFLLFLIILSFIGPAVDDNKSTGDVITDSIYNYITCLDNTANYLVDKYITKGNIKIVPKGKKNYWSSKGLRKPAVSYSGEYNNYSLLPSWQSDDGDISIIEVPPSDNTH